MKCPAQFTFRDHKRELARPISCWPCWGPAWHLAGEQPPGLFSHFACAPSASTLSSLSKFESKEGGREQRQAPRVAGG